LVKGLALARQLPLIGIPTLDILAAAQPLSRLPLLVAIQAGRGRFAAGWYRRSKTGWKAKGPARVMTVKTLVEEVKRPVIVCAELTAEERRMLAGSSEIQLASPAQSIRRPAVTLAGRCCGRWRHASAHLFTRC
jgi:tRNA threonylcarbamoyladenosine biosynthesis protein TsaB